MWPGLALVLACGVDAMSTSSGSPTVRPVDRQRRATRGEPVALCINEVMPANKAAAFDDNGDPSDWIELHNPTHAAIDLAGWSISDDRNEPDRHVFGGRVLEAGGFLLLWADGLAGAGDTHLPFQLDADGEEIAVFDPEGDASVVVYGAVHDDFSLARSADCCTGEGCWTHVFRGTPGVSNDPAAVTRSVALAAGSTWAYRDSGVAPGPGWKLAGYDDGAWSTGAAPMGYGDGHIVTTVSYGSDANDKRITTWFRAELALAQVDEVTEARLDLLRDDGAVVYLNGVELVRSNLPAGDLDPDSLALEAVGGSSEIAYWPFYVDPADLVEGTNVLAVEVHQAAPTSSDLGFDLSLSLTRVESR